jgi:hypothetical protein
LNLENFVPHPKFEHVDFESKHDQLGLHSKHESKL